MRYCITMPQGISGQVEEAWELKGIKFELLGCGCGTVEYEFKTEGTRNDAIKMLKEALRISIYELSDDGELITKQLITLS